MWNPLLELLFLNHGMTLSISTLWTSTWPRSHSLVTLLLIYYDTRRRCSSLHTDILVTIALGASSSYGTIATFVISSVVISRIDEVSMPCTGILVGLDDTTLTCMVTIANAYDLAVMCQLHEFSKLASSPSLWSMDSSPFVKKRPVTLGNMDSAWKENSRSMCSVFLFPPRTRGCVFPHCPLFLLCGCHSSGRASS